MSTERSNDSSMPRRKFLKLSAATVGGLGAAPRAELESAVGAQAPSTRPISGSDGQPARPFNSAYTGAYLDHVAFPLGGLGAGMVCLEGTGALSHVSLRNKPEVFHEPLMFAAVAIKGAPRAARVLEGPVPGWKLFGTPNTGNGAAGTSFGLPRFRNAIFAS